MFKYKNIMAKMLLTGVVGLTTACVNVPPREIDITDVAEPQERFETIENQRDPVLYVQLGEDVLRPKKSNEDMYPDEKIGPFELRSETLAAALQFVLSDYDIPLAFETDEALTRTITISGLKGSVDKVVSRMCSLADLYCSYEDGILTVKETGTFTVALPPIAQETYDDVINGLEAIIGSTPVVDNTTRSIIYSASHRTNENAKNYFDRLRGNTALIVFETQIWEVNLDSTHDTGVDWDAFNGTIGNFGFDLAREGTATIAGGLGIGAQYTSNNLTFDGVFNFLSTQGAVKTVSQPQITVLSGSTAVMRVGNSRQFISEVTSVEGFNNNDDVSVETSTLETGLTLTISSAWDNATVYGNLEIELQDLINLEEVSVGSTSIQLPETSERTLETRIRVRPGDALLIGGIVQERDDYDNEGPGVKKPIFSTRRSTDAQNSELVFMMRPRVIVYTDQIPSNAKVVEIESNTLPAKLFDKNVEKNSIIKDKIPSAEAAPVSEKSIFRPKALTEAEASQLKNAVAEQTQPPLRQDNRSATRSLSTYLDDITDSLEPKDITARP